MESKKAIRLRMLSRRTTPCVDPLAAGHAVAQTLQALPQVQAFSRLAAYCAVNGELALNEFLDQWLADRRPLLLPRFNRHHRQYELVPVSDLRRDLTPGFVGIPEPMAHIPQCSPDLVQAADTGWLVPGLAFDTQGRRLGHGAGFYDRLLQGSAGLRIGIAFEWQIVEDLPEEPHDIPMDMVVTERRVVHCMRPPQGKQ